MLIKKLNDLIDRNCTRLKRAYYRSIITANHPFAVITYGSVKFGIFSNNVIAKGRCFINDGVTFNTGPNSKIIIEDNVTISNNAYITTQNLSVMAFTGRGHSEADVFLGKNVWVAAGCIILPGVTIEENCIVAAGSVVTKSFGPKQLIAGNPANAIKSL